MAYAQVNGTLEHFIVNVSQNSEKILEHMIVAAADVCTTAVLGKGQFSTVLCGTYKSTPVAVKVFKNSSEATAKDLMLEAALQVCGLGTLHNEKQVT